MPKKKSSPSAAATVEQPSLAVLQAALQVSPGSAADLAGRATSPASVFADKDAASASLAQDVPEIDRLQDRLFAEGKRALLVVLQGMDTSGKDGTVRGVFSATGPLGVRVQPFGRPTSEELAHDYLWRVHRVVPSKGLITIFNRSHYEDVLVVKVRGLAPPEMVEQRYAQINDFERLLAETGTTVLKFMLHISREEQGERLRARLADPDKHWKFNPGDLEDRALWADYMKAYDTALTQCSTQAAPWYVVPADSKTHRNAVIARVVCETLKAMDPKPRAPGYRPEDYVID